MPYLSDLKNSLDDNGRVEKDYAYDPEDDEKLDQVVQYHVMSFGIGFPKHEKKRN